MSSNLRRYLTGVWIHEIERVQGWVTDQIWTHQNGMIDKWDTQ